MGMIFTILIYIFKVFSADSLEQDLSKNLKVTDDASATEETPATSETPAATEAPATEEASGTDEVSVTSNPVITGNKTSKSNFDTEDSKKAPLETPPADAED